MLSCFGNYCFPQNEIRNVQVPDVLHVAEVLREHEAHIAGLLSSGLHDSESEQQELSEIWTSVSRSHSGMYHPVFCSERWDETPHSSRAVY